MAAVTVLSEQEADRFVVEWMGAWNSHDVERVLEHYADDVEYFSPFVAQLAGSSGYLAGKEALRPYVAAAFERYPELHFDPPSHVAVGAGSVSMVYRSVNGLLAVETLVFAPGTSTVQRAHCHYRSG
jgi:hypothetical protein